MKSPAPVVLDEVLSPEWLSRALGTPVKAVDVVETIKTVATKVRFRVDFEAEHSNGTSYCVKGLFDGAAPAAGLARMSRAEATFYRDLQASVGVNTPTCRYTGIDDETGHGVIVMDDVVTDGGRFLTALEPYGPEQAVESLEQIAALHASHWGSPRLDDYSWLRSRLAEFAANPLREVDELQGLLDDGRAAPLDPAIADAARLNRALAALAEQASARVETLVHGDTHAGNLFVLNGETALIDWQVLQRSNWGIDIAYHIAAVLSVDDRRRSERDLLDHYLERLASRGIDAPSRDDAWEIYRSSLAYGYYMWAITRRVDRPITLEFVKRLGTAVSDHRTFELLDV